jgi:hypothetical protein
VHRAHDSSGLLLGRRAVPAELGCVPGERAEIHVYDADSGTFVTGEPPDPPNWLVSTMNASG